MLCTVWCFRHLTTGRLLRAWLQIKCEQTYKLWTLFSSNAHSVVENRCPSWTLTPNHTLPRTRNRSQSVASGRASSSTSVELLTSSALIVWVSIREAIPSKHLHTSVSIDRYLDDVIALLAFWRLHWNENKWRLSVFGNTELEKEEYWIQSCT